MKLVELLDLESKNQFDQLKEYFDSIEISSLSNEEIVIFMNTHNNLSNYQFPLDIKELIMIRIETQESIIQLKIHNRFLKTLFRKGEIKKGAQFLEDTKLIHDY